jgi:small subunit ribosomal protein S6
MKTEQNISNSYELFAILDADKKDKARETVMKVLHENGIHIEKEDMWGLRTLAFPIKGKLQGRYVLFNLDIQDKAKVKSLTTELNLLDDVLRFVIVKPGR